MANSKPQIDHSNLFESFIQHIDRPNNSRILFSAPFGNGKSTFLKGFFDKKPDRYISCTICPVNYAVASNQDVFELVKYDLLLGLINRYGKDIDLKKEDFTFLLAGQAFALQKLNQLSIPSFIGQLIGAAKAVGSPANEILGQLKEVLDDVKKFQEKAETNEGELIKVFLEGIEKKAGYIYETDAISKLIFDFLVRIKKKKQIDGQVSVLIIDDLDRLDPEHIFRLFNVFSAHYDADLDSNKFGFDKIIFVCDINNIRNIFQHRYGISVDFSGYIDKFYSHEVFHFDNAKLIKGALKNIINSTPYLESSPVDRYSLHGQTRLYTFFEWLSFSLIEARLLNLRTLITLNHVSLPEYTFTPNNSRRERHAREYHVLIIFHMLKEFWGSTAIVKQNLESLMDYKTHPSYEANHNDVEHLEKEIISFILPFLIPAKDGFPVERGDSENESSHHISGKSIIVHYILSKENTNNSVPIFKKFTRPNLGTPIHISTYELLVIAYEECLKRRMLG